MDLYNICYIKQEWMVTILIQLCNTGDRQFIGSMNGNKEVERKAKDAAKQLAKIQKDEKNKKSKK